MSAGFIYDAVLFDLFTFILLLILSINDLLNFYEHY